MESNFPLIRTKLQAPRLAGDLVQRQDLFERLDSGLESQLTLVSAPAGYGKTTLVASWLQERPHLAAWFSLDANDNDLLYFLRYMVAAIRTLYPDSCLEIQKMTRADYEPPPEFLAALLINDIYDIEDSFVLVIDDFHLIDDVSVSALVSTLIENQPFNIHLVIITRTDPLLPLARLRASGKMTEMRASDLRFQNDRAWRFLNQALRNTVTKETAATLNAQAEGWITGLRLIALSAPDEGKLSRILANSQMGSTSFVNEYLRSEVLPQLPASLRAFLLQSSILNRLSGPLCDAVMLSGDAVWTGQDYLGWLKNANIFVFGLDDQDEWYRFHNLFKSLLVKELHATYSEKEIYELHRRASHWFAEQGLVEEAMHHALEANDNPLAADIVEKRSHDLLNRLERHTLEKWLSLLPQDLIWQRPRLTLANAWLFYREWRLSEMELSLKNAETMLTGDEGSENESVATWGQIATLQSIISLFCYQEYEQSLHLAEEALASLPEVAIDARATAIGLKAVAIQALGDLQKAVQVLDSIIISPTLSDVSKIQPFIGLAIVYHAEAQLVQLSQVLSRFLTFAMNLGNPNALSFANKTAGVLYYEWNDLDRASDHFTTTLEHRYQSNFMATFDASLGVARIHLVRGLVEKAQAVIDELRTETLRVKSLDLMGSLEAFQAYLWLVQGNTLAALNWARSITPGTVHESILLSEVADLTRAYILIEIGSHEELIETVGILRKKLEDAQKSHFALRNIQTRIHLALAYERLGQRDNALNELEQALLMAQPGVLIRSFTDRGPAILSLLNELKSANVDLLYLKQIIESFPDSEFSAKPRMEEELVDIFLTPRQSEILILLKRGYSYQEIAENLGVSLNTVKKHVSNIYEKLEVSNRQQAIYKANAIGILP